MPANLENLEVATGLEKFSFHSNPKERLKTTRIYSLTALAAGSKKIKVMAEWFPSEDSKESVPCLSPRFW